MLSQIQEMRQGGMVENRIVSVADQVSVISYLFQSLSRLVVMQQVIALLDSPPCNN